MRWHSQPRFIDRVVGAEVPAVQRAVIKHGGLRTTIVAVPTPGRRCRNCAERCGGWIGLHRTRWGLRSDLAAQVEVTVEPQTADTGSTYPKTSERKEQ